MEGFIQTVRGRISPDQLGSTLTHEHVLWNHSHLYLGDAQPDMIPLLDAEITLETRADIFYEVFNNRCNLTQEDVDLAGKELTLLKNEGGGTVVELTTVGLNPNPEGLRKASEESGINIVTGSGFYLPDSLPKTVREWLEKATEDEITEYIINDFKKGLYGTDVKAGVIGEIGVLDFYNKIEMKILRASIAAQKELGCALYFDCSYTLSQMHLMFDLVEKLGGNLEKTVLCHCQGSDKYTDLYNTFAKRGIYIEFDQFSMNFHRMDIVDFLLKDAVYRQFALGNVNKILISQDICFSAMLVKYGGFGYRYINRWVKPMMEREGYKREFDIITLENPRNLLTINKGF